MEGDLKDAFTRIKPVCDVLMVCPTVESIGAFVARVSELKQEVVLGLQQYLLFPLLTHLKSTEIEKKYDLQCSLVDAIRVVLERISVNSIDMTMKIETGVLQLIFDNSRPGMIADVPEELKHSAMRTLTVLMLSIDNMFREALMKTQVPLIAQAVFVSVHIAKLEKLRALRLAAIYCVTAHTLTHPQLTKGYHIRDPALETVTVDTLMSILPGVLAAMQDVATCPNNPGHAVVVAAIEAIHRILCVTMHDKHATKRRDLSVADFAKLAKEKAQSRPLTDVSSKGKNPKNYPKRSPEWYAMAGDKLLVITKSLVPLRTHEHYKVRKELAIYCSRVIFECNTTMQPSIPLCLDILISLSKDEYPEVSERSSNAINAYFAKASDETKNKTLDSLCENFFTTLTSLPRIMNNIDSSRKLSALNLVHGYIQVLSAQAGAARLTAALSALEPAQGLCNALLETAALHADLTLLTRHAARDVTAAPPTNSPWCKLRHLDTEDCETRLQDICQLLGAAECSETLLDKLTSLFHQGRDSELAYIMNLMVASPKASANLAKRVLDIYIDENLWYLPLEVGSSEPPVSENETLDVSVYNPRAWEKDSVPGLYEGTVETRYTGISYKTPRVRPRADTSFCATLAEAQRNMVLCCLLTEGVGAMSRRLLDEYDPFLLRTLCLILERVGSQYQMLHLAGLKAINDIAAACGHICAAELIRYNADYFTSQVTTRLKKAWHCQSALQILSVVMEFSDSSILNYLYGVVQDVLVQSCDKFYEKDLQAYLQVFLAFVEYIRKWFYKPEEKLESAQIDKPIDIMKDLKEFIANKEEEEKLLSNEEFEEASGKSVEEMYKEDIQKKEEDILDYDDTVTHEKKQLPQHVSVTMTILKRSLNFVVSSNRDNSILSLQVLNRGLPLLKDYEDELLPLVHLIWSPLVAKFEMGDTVVMKRAFDLLVIMAELSRDFIRSRAVKEVLPHIYKYLRKSSKDSYLKDVGSAYRSSQAYQLQEAALAALPTLAVNLEIQDEGLTEAMQCVDPYLSNKQPKPLQALAVDFFKAILEYEFGAAWYHLRQLCDNTEVLSPPVIEGVTLKPVVGTPFAPKDADYEKNVTLIFENTVS